MNRGKYAEFWQITRKQFAVLLLTVGAVDMLACVITNGYSGVDWIALGRMLCQVNLIAAGVYGLLVPERRQSHENAQR